ncbi:MAG: hypothetical protein ACFFDN_25815 [Candidatus Hodarchaeota archaeon]
MTSNIILKSKIPRDYAIYAIFLFISAIAMLIIFLLFQFGYIFTMPGDSGGYFLILSVIFFWFALQFIGSYLIIYDDGIKVKKPFKFLRHKFISWDLIEDIKLFDVGKVGDDFDYISYNAIYIFVKEQPDSIIISGRWVDKIESVYDLMTKYIEPVQKPEFCANHPEIEVEAQCRNCGNYVCNACIEHKEFFQIYSECSFCIFKKGLHRTIKFHLLAVTGPLGYFLLYIINLSVKIYGNLIIFSIFVIPYLVSICSILFLTPYTYGIHLANIHRRIYLKRFGIKFSNNLFIIISLAIIPLFLLNYFWIQFIFLGTMDISIQLFVSYVIYTIIITIISYLFELPRKIVKSINP